MLKYVVDVTEPHDPEAGIRGYTRRFEFDTEDAAERAKSSAIASGLEARDVVKVKSRELVSA